MTVPGVRFRQAGRATSVALTLLAATAACGGGWQLKGSKTAAEVEEVGEEGVQAPKGELTKVVRETKPSAAFMVDGKPLCFVGSNQYYLTWKSKKMIDDVFANAQKIGVKVLRHWAFLDRGSLDGQVPHLKDDGTKEGVYFQYWDTEAGRPAYNEGEDGLPRLDYLLQKARETGVRIVMVLTNNWPDFGGMDQYLLWYGLNKHPQFYTDDRVKKAYKDWVSYLINRTNSLTGVPYKEDPYIFSWELANEPRTRNYTNFDSPEGWDINTINDWAGEMAAHVRSVDQHHMIAVGDEGFFADGGSGDQYNGADGVDHKGLLAIKDVDYGTFHLYPDHWGTGIRWADRWIEDHIVAARQAGKPTVLEEYGAIVARDEKDPNLITWGWDRRVKAYKQWNDLMVERGGAGSMFWMLAGQDDYTGKQYTDFDHFTVYSPEIDPTAQLLQGYAQRFASDAQACTVGGSTPIRGVPEGFVVPARPSSGQARVSLESTPLAMNRSASPQVSLGKPPLSEPSIEKPSLEEPSLEEIAQLAR